MFLRDYEVFINIGVHDYEKRGEQRVLINVQLFVPLAESTPLADKLDEVVDYDFKRENIAKRVGLCHIHLQEHLSDHLASAQLEQPRLRAVGESTEKPDVYPDCHSVGIEVFKMKDV